MEREFPLSQARLLLAAGLGKAEPDGGFDESWQLGRTGDDEAAELHGELGGVPNGIRT